MISRFAYEKLNDPDRIRERDLWFSRLSHLFAGEADEYNSRYVFTVYGVTPWPRGTSIKADEDITREKYDSELMELTQALPGYSGEEAQARLQAMRSTLGRARAFDRDGEAMMNVPTIAYDEPKRYIEESLEKIALMPRSHENRFVPYCAEYGIYGVHFIDRMLGADVFFKYGQWHARYLKTPIGHLLICSDILRRTG